MFDSQISQTLSPPEMEGFHLTPNKTQLSFLTSSSGRDKSVGSRTKAAT